MKILTFLFLFTPIIYCQVNFDDYFINKTLRLDYFHTGDKSHDSYSFDEMKAEPFWGGSHKNLIDKFNVGAYKVVVLDDSTKKKFIRILILPCFMNGRQPTKLLLHLKPSVNQSFSHSPNIK